MGEGNKPRLYNCAEGAWLTLKLMLAPSALFLTTLGPVVVPWFYAGNTLESLNVDFYCLTLASWVYFTYVFLALILSHNIFKWVLSVDPRVVEEKQLTVARKLMSITVRIIALITTVPVFFYLDFDDGLTLNDLGCSNGVEAVVANRCFFISKMLIRVYLIWDLISCPGMPWSEKAHHVIIVSFSEEMTSFVSTGPSDQSDSGMEDAYVAGVCALLYFSAGLMLFNVVADLVYILCPRDDYVLRRKRLSVARFAHAAITFPFIFLCPGGLSLWWTANGKFSTPTLVMGFGAFLFLFIAEVYVAIRYGQIANHFKEMARTRSLSNTSYSRTRSL